MNEDPLYKLIKSFSSSEKGDFFRLYPNADKLSGVLFNAIYYAKGPEDSAILKSFPNINAYYQARRNLKKDLDRFLLAKDFTTSPIILQRIVLSQKYIDRGIYETAMYHLSKAKKQAWKMEEWEELALIFKTQEEIPGQADSPDLTKEHERYRNEKAKLEAIEELHTRLRGYIRGLFSEDPMLFDRDAILEAGDKINEDPPFSVKGQLELYALFRRTWFFKEDYREAIQYALKSIALLEAKLEKEPELIGFQQRLIEETSNLAQLHNAANDHSSLISTLAKIKFLSSANPQFDELKHFKYSLPLVAHAIHVGDLGIA